MNTNLNMQRMPIDRLKPAKYNPRKDLKPGDPAYEKIKRSLHDFGYVDPIVWNEVTGNIVGGHQRYKVLVNEGATEVDCVVVHIENPQDEKALNIALNKATGDWEPTALADLLQDLQLSGYDLGATGFDAAEVDDLFSKVHDKETTEDDFDVEEELKQPAFSRKGDIWHLGRHVVLCGDSTLPESYEQLLSGTKVNMILSDLPYFVAYHGTAGTIQNDNLPDAEALEFTLKAMRCMYNALADDGSIYIFHADTKGLIFRKAFDEAGFYLSGCCIWKKNSLVLGRSPYRITRKNGIEIDPEQAKVVREMYARIIRGDTLTSIVRWLNRNGHLGAFGGKWTAGQLRAALSNEKYMGHSLLQKQFRNNHIDKTLVSNQGELPQYYATETHPAIIDEATFDAAQQALERIAAQKPASKPWEHHIFTGMIICSACGKHYRHVKNHGKSRWACPTYIMEGKAFCESKQIPEEIIMRIACDLLGWNSFDEEAFKEAVDHVTAVYPHILIFHLRDGREETLEWQNRSRAESWTPEMKEKAREKARRKNDGKNSD